MSTPDIVAVITCYNGAPYLGGAITSLVEQSLVRMLRTRSELWPALLPDNILVDAKEACLKRCIVPQNVVVVRRAEVIAAGGYDERMRIASDYVSSG